MLQRIFDTLKPMQSILARELLGTALAAIEGHMIRVLCFSHGRSMDASESYEHWHPLEWFAKDPRGLFSEYHLYRELMAQAVLGRPDNARDAAAVRRILDLIHLRYMVRHAPDGALAFIADQKMPGVPFDEYWPQPEIHQPLYETACIGPPPRPPRPHQSNAASPAWSATTICIRTFPLRWARLPRRKRRPWTCCAASTITNWRLPSETRTGAPACSCAPSWSHADTIRASPPFKRNVTVSVLFCNYNDARFLPDSLGAICTQSRLPEEVIVLDDGSTDNSLEIIEEFGRRYPFVRILKNETNRGLLYSINRALQEAHCDFVVWAAADDLLMPGFLERNAQYLREFPAAGMTFSRLAVFKDGSDDITSFTGKSRRRIRLRDGRSISCRRLYCGNGCSGVTFGFPPTRPWRAATP